MKFVWIFVLPIISVYGSLNQLDNAVVGIIQSASTKLQVSSRCNDSLNRYIENLESSGADQWALKMLDATSKIPVGVLYSLNFAEFGDFERCLATESADRLIQPKYCLAHLSIPTGTSQTIDRYLLQRQVQLRRNVRTMIGSNNESRASNSGVAPKWAICLPDACTDEDITSILAQVIKPSMLQCQTKDDLNPSLTGGAVTAIIILLLFLVIVVISTAYDLYSNNQISVTKYELLVAFSAYSNGKKLFSITNNSTELSCLNGIRVLSMIWVVVGHMFMMMILSPLFNLIDGVNFTNSLRSMLIVSGTLSVDTFFVVGGVLVAYTFMKSRLNGIKFNLFHFYLHRYLRLTPPLAATVLVSATLLEYMGSGPNWGDVKPGLQENCQTYWWSTLLYVQNYVNVNYTCLGQAWYLNVDVQLYIISPLFLFLLIKYPKVGLGLLVSCALATMATSFAIAYDLELSAILTSTSVKGSQHDYLTKYYVQPYTRAAPWIFGVIFGIYIGETKILVVFTWAVTVAVLLTCIFAGHSTLRGPEYDRLGNSFYIALTRPAWAVAVACVIFACATGYGGPVNWMLSWPVYQVLNRFSYCIYLLHLTIMYMMSSAAKWGMYFSGFQG
ncbi:hypothetical protein NQ318_014214, partial [Aromia moschata]